MKNHNQCFTVKSYVVCIDYSLYTNNEFILSSISAYIIISFIIIISQLLNSFWIGFQLHFLEEQLTKPQDDDPELIETFGFQNSPDKSRYWIIRISGL